VLRGAQVRPVFPPERNPAAFWTAQIAGCSNRFLVRKTDGCVSIFARLRFVTRMALVLLIWDNMFPRKHESPGKHFCGNLRLRLWEAAISTVQFRNRLENQSTDKVQRERIIETWESDACPNPWTRFVRFGRIVTE
jgi:hypothetical protein